MSISDNIKRIREQFDLTQDELGEIAGVSGGAVSTWERGTAEPRMGAIQKIADHLNISKADIVDDNETTYKSTGVSIPIVSSIVAGLPADVYEDPQGYEEISHELARTGEFICLKVKGDSMSPVIQDGDLVVIRSQQDVDSGDIAAVRINGDESTLKQVQKSEAGITLIAYNPSIYPPHFYSNKEIEELPIEIDGKVVEMKRIF